MDNKQLNSFLQAAELGSFSKAAQKAFVSVTALIQQINLLEARLKVKLFIRSHRGLTLTPSGKIFYKDAKYMLDYWRESVSRARLAAASEGPAPVRIGTSIITPSRFLLDLWPHIQKENPALKIQLVSFENTPENARGILSRLGENIDVVAGLIDEGFSSAYGCKMLELFQAPVCCALSRHHPLASKKILTMKDLAGQKLLLLKRNGFRRIDALRADISRKCPQIEIVSFPFYDITVFNQCETQGTLLMTIENWDNVHPLLKTLPVKWDYTLPFGLMFSPKPSPQVRDFLKAVQKIKNAKPL
ncbi:MAG: LysR family transcriptional regulator [Elusimicrobia bacterium]|nr:LysR family transcriptional regulator [Elusimicrobiota bacterium]